MAISLNATQTRPIDQLSRQAVWTAIAIVGGAFLIGELAAMTMVFWDMPAALSYVDDADASATYVHVASDCQYGGPYSAKPG
ncbi:hypothetical protein ACFXJ8_07240 [Nonomuraea sp. NPDC059194]|uniref:hypothetical protein n=1 Tax=Nonomuraea sp. NPDC059194 TaxID=3346764 RepID=UPI00368F5E18